MDQRKSQLGLTREEKDALIREWENSGVSKKQFAEFKGINYMTFIGWFSRRPSKDRPVKKQFIPLQVSTTGSAFAEIHLSNSRKIILLQPVELIILQGILKC